MREQRPPDAPSVHGGVAAPQSESEWRLERVVRLRERRRDEGDECGRVFSVFLYFESEIYYLIARVCGAAATAKCTMSMHTHES